MAVQLPTERHTGITVDSKLIRVSTADMTKADWLKFRENGIGASEIATVMGLNQYKSAHQLFYEKVEGAPEQDDSIAMFMGRYNEDSIADLWQYWENDQLTMMKNYSEKKIVRKCRKINAYLINPDFPHLFVSLDRVINKNGTDKEQALELKTISAYSSDQWISGIPPQYIVQLQQQLLVSGLEEGELCILKDGRYMEVYSFSRNQEIINNIIEQSTHFWNNVIEARKLRAQGLPYEHLEPEIDNIEAYKDFLNERFTATAQKAEPTDDIYFTGMEYLKCNEDEKAIKLEKTRLSNIIKAHMGEASMIDYGTGGKITWNENKAGNRTLRVDLKETKKAEAA